MPIRVGPGNVTRVLASIDFLRIPAGQDSAPPGSENPDSSGGLWQAVGHPDYHAATWANRPNYFAAGSTTASSWMERACSKLMSIDPLDCLISAPGQSGFQRRFRHLDGNSIVV